MKKTTLFTLTVLITLLSSCNSEKYENRIKELEEQLEVQKNQYNEIFSSQNDRFLEKNEILENQVRELESNVIAEEDLAFLLKEDSWLGTNNIKLAEYFFNEMNIIEYDAESALKSSWLLHPGYRKYALGDEMFFANYMASKIDRSPESLEKVFSPEVKEVVYSLLGQDDLYYDSGAYAMVNALLLSYESFKNDRAPLSNIYTIAKESDIGDDKITYIINTMVTDEIKDALSEEGYTTYENHWSTPESRLSTIYTFWARRHNEGNLDFTYLLLKELHENLIVEQYD